MGKCKFWKKCNLYGKEDESCNRNNGMEYEDGDGMRPSGCYRKMEELKNGRKTNL